MSRSPTRPVSRGAASRALLWRIWRASLTTHSLLTPAEAASALPIPRADAAAWMDRQRFPTLDVAGHRMVRWGDVLDAVQGRGGAPVPSGQWVDARTCAALLAISERHLRELLARGEITEGAIRLGSAWRFDVARIAEALRPPPTVPSAPPSGAAQFRSWLLDEKERT